MANESRLATAHHGQAAITHHPRALHCADAYGLRHAVSDKRRQQAWGRFWRKAGHPEWAGAQ